MPRWKKNPPPGVRLSSPASSKGSKPSAPSKPQASKPEPKCELVLCEDPQTGEILVKPSGKCPPGYIEKFRDKAQESGITFVIPKVYTREE